MGAAQYKFEKARKVFDAWLAVINRSRVKEGEVKGKVVACTIFDAR